MQYLQFNLILLHYSHPIVHSKAVNTLRNILTNHDWDPRYAEPLCRARVANLYLPLIRVVMDCLPQLYDWHNERSKFLFFF